MHRLPKLPALALALCWLALAAPAARGQVNTEKLRTGVDEAGFGGSFRVDVSLKTGNTEKLALGGGFRIHHATLATTAPPPDAAEDEAQAAAEEQQLETDAEALDALVAADSVEVATALSGHDIAQEAAVLAADPPAEVGEVYTRDLVFLVTSYDFSEENDTKSDNNGFSHLRWVHQRRPGFGFETFVQHQFNEFTRLATRYLVGGGLRVGLLRSPRREVYVGTGYMFEFERLDPLVEGDVRDETRSHRWTNYLSLKLESADGRLRLVNTTYAQPRFDDFADFRLLDEAELGVDLRNNISLGLALSLAFDNQPPVGVERSDLSLTNRIRFSF
ncbi:MAG: DUF481 domain-containing protein [Acidobacteria bacterium]|nr:DUF481 domain-containing protein [Acidobacteriota bacterium]